MRLLGPPAGGASSASPEPKARLTGCSCPLRATPNPRPRAGDEEHDCREHQRRCPSHESERTTVDGHDVFLIQTAPCGIGDCPAAFFINGVHYIPTCGDLPRWLRAEASRGLLFAVAVADPDATPPLPYVRATRLARIEPRWIVGGRFTVCQGPKWTIAWADLADALQAAVCDTDRPPLAAIIGVDCR